MVCRFLGQDRRRLALRILNVLFDKRDTENLRLFGNATSGHASPSATVASDAKVNERVVLFERAGLGFISTFMRGVRTVDGQVLRLAV